MHPLQKSLCTGHWVRGRMLDLRECERHMMHPMYLTTNSCLNENSSVFVCGYVCTCMPCTFRGAFAGVPRGVPVRFRGVAEGGGGGGGRRGVFVGFRLASRRFRGAPVCPTCLWFSAVFSNQRAQLAPLCVGSSVLFSEPACPTCTLVFGIEPDLRSRITCLATKFAA